MTSIAGASFAQAYAPVSAGTADLSPQAAGDELGQTLRQEIDELLARLHDLDRRIAWKYRQLQLLDLIEQSADRTSADRTSADRAVEPVDAEVDTPPGAAERRRLHPATPIEQLSLARRTVNCLRNDGVLTLRDLTVYTEAELMQVRNFGRKCLGEVVDLLASQGLTLGRGFAGRSGPDGEDQEAVPEGPLTIRDRLPTEGCEALEVVRVAHAECAQVGVARLLEIVHTPLEQVTELWGMTADAAVEYAQGLVILAARITVEDTVSPMDEIALAIARGSDIDRAFAIRYFGLDGELPRTLEAIGASHGVTRERARQRIERFRNRVLVARPPLPFTEAVVRALAPDRTYSLQDWYEALPASLRPERPDDLLRLRTVGDWGWLSPLTWYEHGSLLLVAGRENGQEWIRGIVHDARSVLKPHRSIGAVAPDAILGDDPVAAGRLRVVLRADSRWVELTDEWFVLRRSHTVGLGSRARRLIELMGPLSVGELRGALRREMRRRDATRALRLPPRDVFMSQLRRAGCTLVRGTDRVMVRNPRGAGSLSASDRAILAAFSGERGAVTVHELDAAMHEAGLSQATARGASAFSPLLRHVQYGVYSMLGSDVGADEIAAAAVRLQAHARRQLITSSLDQSGAVTITYALPEGAERPIYPLGVNTLPAASWTASDADGNERPLEVRDGRIHGLRTFTRRAIDAGAHQFRVRFDPAKGTASVSWDDSPSSRGNGPDASSTVSAGPHISGQASDPAAASLPPGEHVKPSTESVRPIPNSYRLPGTLLHAGEYPGSPPSNPTSDLPARLAGFLDAGITVFVDLTDPADGLAPYLPALRALAAERGVEVHHEHLIIRDMDVCNVAYMREVLGVIDGHLTAGRSVYVHCWGGIGRTGLVVGCWLVRHGRSGGGALDEVNALFRTMSPRKVARHELWGSPQTDAQRSMVREWAVHEEERTVTNDEGEDGGVIAREPRIQVNEPTVPSRYRAALLGLAVGDALGTTLEFQPAGTFAPLDDMIGGGPFDLRPGQWTDDTSMALCLAESLLECRGFDAADQMRRYIRWKDEGYWSSTGVCFDIGNTTRASLDAFRRTGNPFSGPADERSAGNGSLMRLAPVPLHFALDPELAIRMAADSSRTTHGAATAVDACRYFAGLIVGALQGRAKAELLAPHFSPVAGLWEREPLHPEVAAVAAGSFRSKSPPSIRGTGYVIDSLEAALWAFASTDDFRAGALAAVNLGDDADTTGAVYGQIAGAYYGEEGIPSAWRERITRGDDIAALADGLCRAAVHVAQGSDGRLLE